MNRLRGFLLHIGVVCSFVCIIMKILDWYNPYMDFSGHMWFVQVMLYLAVIMLAATGKNKGLKQEKRRNSHMVHAKKKYPYISGQKT